MIFLLLFMVIKNGFGNYWPGEVVSFDLKNGEKLMGEVTRVEKYTKSSIDATRYLIRIGNFELTNEHFRWVNESDIDKKYYDKNAVLGGKTGVGEILWVSKSIQNRRQCCNN